MSGTVLVSGAGVAGSCLAWWLDRYGYAVTLVEQAPEPRTGGYVIDFWGLGYDVAEKMGVLDELRRHDLKVQEFRIVNRGGRRISGFNQGAVQKLIKGRGMSLPRSALASALYEAVKDRVDVRFGNSVTSLDDSPRGVEVTFREGEPQTFDLVIGADGLHSAVRRLCFGEETRFERFLGYYVAAFTAQGYRFRDPDAYVTYGEPGRQIWRITVDEDSTVFMLVFADPDPHAAPDPRFLASERDPDPPLLWRWLGNRRDAPRASGKHRSLFRSGQSDRDAELDQGPRRSDRRRVRVSELARRRRVSDGHGRSVHARWRIGCRAGKPRVRIRDV